MQTPWTSSRTAATLHQHRVSVRRRPPPTTTLPSSSWPAASRCRFRSRSTQTSATVAGFDESLRIFKRDVRIGRRHINALNS